MNEYFCELIHDGVIKKSFYIKFESEEKLRERIDEYEWPEGEWTITNFSEAECEDICRISMY